MVESSNPNVAIFGLKVKLRPLLNSWSALFGQLELNDLFLLFGFHLALQVSDILLPHPSLPHSFCLGSRFHESPIDLISCEANRIPFVSQDIDLDSWADSLRAWPNPPEGWVSWYNRMVRVHQSTWEAIGIADALSLSLSPLDKNENLLKTIGYFWSDALNFLCLAIVR
jgi:hypothetical protein